MSPLARTVNDERYAAFPPLPLLSPFRPRPHLPDSPSSGGSTSPDWPLKCSGTVPVTSHQQYNDSPPNTPPDGHTFFHESTHDTAIGDDLAESVGPYEHDFQGPEALKTPLSGRQSLLYKESQSISTPIPKNSHIHSVPPRQRLACRSSMPSNLRQMPLEPPGNPQVRLRSLSLGQKLTYPPPRTSSLANRTLHRSSGSRELRQRALSEQSQIPAWVEKVIAASKTSPTTNDVQHPASVKCKLTRHDISEARFMPIESSPVKAKVIVIPKRMSSATWPLLANQQQVTWDNRRSTPLVQNVEDLESLEHGNSQTLAERRSSRSATRQQNVGKPLPTYRPVESRSAQGQQPILNIQPPSRAPSKPTFLYKPKIPPKLPSRHIVNCRSRRPNYLSPQNATTPAYDPIAATIISDLESIVLFHPATPLALSSPCIQKIQLAMHRAIPGRPAPPHSRYSPLNPLRMHPPSENIRQSSSSSAMEPPRGLGIIFPSASNAQVGDLTATFLALNYLSSLSNNPSSSSGHPLHSAISPHHPSLTQPPPSSLQSSTSLDIPPKARGLLGLHPSPSTPSLRKSNNHHNISTININTHQIIKSPNNLNDQSLESRIEDLCLALRISARGQIREIQGVRGRSSGKVVDEGLVRAVGVVVGLSFC